MSLLEKIEKHTDLRQLKREQLPQLAQELRDVILETVSRTGGHLASNLGAVELTIALLRTFSPPSDKIIWDVGHQTYTWKLLTGRRSQFHTLRQYGGLSGFPKPSESPCDAFVGGHAGTALSAALGTAAANHHQGRDDHVVAIIGDGSMTNGITLEALNNIGDTAGRIIVILNDNEMSISESVGALSRGLGRMLVDVRYNRIKAAAEAAGHRLRMTPLRRIYHRIEQAVKSIWLRNALFEEFGLRYIGPIDGHDLNALENALQSARHDKRSVLIHIATQKGRGFRPAERSPSNWHGVGKFPLDARKVPEGGAGYSLVAGQTLTELAARHPELVTITAAMAGGTGLDTFARSHPTRFFDVGICESHAMVFAAGLAAAGMKPVFAVYSTFLQRAIDSVMHDICLPNLPVTLCIDRAGIVGSDGPTHHGIYDIAMLRCLPNLSLLQPKDEAELVAMLHFAIGHPAPVAIRYPREPGPGVPLDSVPAAIPYGKAEIILQPDQRATAAVWFWALGDMLPLAQAAALLLKQAGEAAGVVNPRFIKPLDSELLCQQAGGAAAFVTIENGALAGGFGSAVRETLAQHGLHPPLHAFGWPDTFVAQGSSARLMQDHGLTAEAIAHTVLRALRTSRAADS